jgi:hypothetical protein
MDFGRAIPIGGDPRQRNVTQQPQQHQIKVEMPEGYMHLIELGFNASIQIFPDSEFIWNGMMLFIPKGYRDANSVVRNLSAFGHPLMFHAVKIPAWWDIRCEKDA